jgi:tRNA A-37 threonylcarbamoyl transferase component Bud32
VAPSCGGDQIGRFVRELCGPGLAVQAGPVWLVVRPAGSGLPEHGWKLHVSSRAVTYPALVAALVPVLVAEGCAFKLARSQDVLAGLNDGVTSPSAVGKAVTIYPDQGRVRALGCELAGLLAGHQGPRVLSDRRVSASAPVYYRYGPFIASPVLNIRGGLESWMHGPHGERFGAIATLRYRQPPWAADPFAGEVGQSAAGARELEVVGGRYQITAGIRESACGNVYRGTDPGGCTVIIKQARAFVAEDAAQYDARLRLRNERRVLQVLDGVAGVPRFVDHFRHADDEFLVTSDCGPRSLAEEVLRGGPYSPAPAADSRGLDHLARQLAQILSSIHARGVLVRDLTPGNVVIDNGRVSVVDFGLAAYCGLHLTGSTPGYAPARQVRGEPPAAADDLFGLGMTLLFAVSRLHPVALGDDLDLPRLRALQAIRSGYGPSPDGVVGAITGLLAGGEAASVALDRLAQGRAHAPARSAMALPAAPEVTEDLIAEITASLLGDLLDMAETILRASPESAAAHDISIYSGTAGIGLELLRHDGPRAAAVAAELAGFSARTARRESLPPGLFGGATGIEVFLHAARSLGIDAPESGPAGTVRGRALEPPGDDLIDGAAGVGLGHLFIYRCGGDPSHLDIARTCGAAVMSAGRLAPDPDGDLDRCGAAELSAGRAHGLAGLTDLLLALAEEAAGDIMAAGNSRPGEGADMAKAAASRTRHLAERARSLISRARDAQPAPASFSWCQGLAGIGQTLLHAGAVLDEPAFTELARQAADACIAHVPTIGAIGQCCGACGVGNFLIDVASLDSCDRYWQAAYDVAAHLLRRSAGTASHPVFARSHPDSFAASWASGLTGVLTFFRRLSRHGGPDCIPVYHAP